MYDEEYEYISGGISGAITDLESEEAYTHALKRYLFFRTIDHDIDKIAKNTGIDRKKIAHIKSYLFIDNTIVDENGIPAPFDPNFAIAASWDRLAFFPNEIKPHDMILLQHELCEMSLFFQGMNQDEAHIIASEKYNYAKAADDYYAELKLKQKRIHKSTPISIDFLISFKSKIKKMINKMIKKAEKHLTGGRKNG